MTRESIPSKGEYESLFHTAKRSVSTIAKETQYIPPLNLNGISSCVYHNVERQDGIGLS